MTNVHITKARFRAEAAIVPPPPWMFEGRVDGVSFGAADVLAMGSTNLLGGFWIGAYASGSLNAFNLDDAAAGTSTWGATDLFMDDFSGATIAPPFDSVTGTDLMLSGGTLRDDGTTDATAIKNLSIFSGGYFQVKAKMDASMIAAGGSTADFIDVFDSDINQLFGIYYDTAVGWTLYEGNGPGIFPISGLATAGVWYTLDLHVFR